MSIKKILVPLDGSNNSFKGLTHAIDLARCCDAKIYGIYVITFYPAYWSVMRPPSEKILLKEGEKTLNKAKKRCEKSKVGFSSKIITDLQASSVIVSFASKQKCDLIVMGSLGKGTLERLFLGSTSNYVVHKSKIPVTIVN